MMVKMLIQLSTGSSAELVVQDQAKTQSLLRLVLLKPKSQNHRSSPFIIYPRTNGRIIRASCVIFLWEIQAPIVSPVLQPQALVLALFLLDPLLPLSPSIFRSSSIQLKL